MAIANVWLGGAESGERRARLELGFTCTTRRSGSLCALFGFCVLVSCVTNSRQQHSLRVLCLSLSPLFEFELNKPNPDYLLWGALCSGLDEGARGAKSPFKKRRWRGF
jgi:hypothetical protein